MTAGDCIQSMDHLKGKDGMWSYVACDVGASKVVSEASEENLWRRTFYAYLYHFFLPHSHVLNFPPNDIVVELHPLLNPSVGQKIGRMYGALVLMSQSLTTSLLL